MENTSHQTATLTNDSRIAVSVSGMPKLVGIRIHNKLMTSRSPPPRYPIAYAAVDTRSISSGRAMCGSSES